MKNNRNLPDYCFAQDIMNEEEIIIIKSNEEGCYHPTGEKGDAMEYNKAIGVTENQMRAMIVGSMFGWNVPGANPEHYEKYKVEAE